MLRYVKRCAMGDIMCIWKRCCGVKLKKKKWSNKSSALKPRPGISGNLAEILRLSTVMTSGAQTAYYWSLLGAFWNVFRVEQAVQLSSKNLLWKLCKTLWGLENIVPGIWTFFFKNYLLLTNIKFAHTALGFREFVPKLFACRWKLQEAWKWHCLHRKQPTYWRITRNDRA